MDATNIFAMFARATNYAHEKHKEQEYDGHPYSFHIKEVLFLAIRYELNFSQILAAILHDTLEDTDATWSDLAEQFGETVADLVDLVTDEPGRTRRERKFANIKKLGGHPEAIAVKLCDRIANIEYNMSSLNMGKLNMYLDEDYLFSTLDDGRNNRDLWRKYRSLIDVKRN